MASRGRRGRLLCGANRAVQRGEAREGELGELGEQRARESGGKKESGGVSLSIPAPGAVRREPGAMSSRTYWAVVVPD